MPSFIEDPRSFAGPDVAKREPIVRAALRSLDSGAAGLADEIDRGIVQAFADLLVAGRSDNLSAAFAHAPSSAVARHLARRLGEAWIQASQSVGASGVAISVFAIPLVVVVAGDAGSEPFELAGALADPAAAAALLREHGALRGNRTLTLASSLVLPDVVELDRIGDWLGQQRIGEGTVPAGIDIAAAPIAVVPGEERVFLRFLVGAALSAPGAPLFAVDDRRWAMPLGSTVRAQLLRPGATLLVLPRRPQPPFAALVDGRAAHREVAAQIFASNAIRRLRGAVGEPDAIVSAHRCPDAPNGGELRLSLSSPFDERRAEGFRCPLHPWERAADIAEMLQGLLRDCRVDRVQVMSGIHADRDATTGLRLFFKSGAALGLQPEPH